ncbi:MAG TPA: metallophosphoesterase [Terriglobales bacterium]|nr:metallophosphoesterase [Terriglobales bacterium]
MSFLTRRRFLQVAAGVAATGALALGEGSIILEPNHPILTAVEVVLPRLPAAFDGFTIAQLSDFHYDERSVVPIRAAIEIVKNLHPDVIVLTGDFATVPPFHREFHTAKGAAKAVEPCASLLSQLRPRPAIVSVLGNHDVASDVRRIIETLDSHGLPVLRNRSIPIEHGGSRIWLSGLDDVWEGDPDLNLALHGVPSDELVVLLVHEPDFADEAVHYPVDLQLSGHSHGGQIWLPGIGAPWLPMLARKYPRGMYRVGPLTLYTNMGLGTIRLPIRLNCRPEVTLFTLRSRDGAVKETNDT